MNTSKINRSMLALIFASAALSAPATSRAVVIAVDHFSNGSMIDLDGSTGGTGWAGPWTTVNSSLQTGVGGAGLGFPGLASSPGGATTPSGGSFDAAEYSRAIAPYAAPGGVVYISFLLRPDAGYGSYGGLQIGQYPAMLQFGTPMGYYLYGFRMGRYVFEVSTAPVQEGRTVFLVLEIDASQSPALFNMYVNPDPRYAKPAFPHVSRAGAGFPTHPTSLTLINDGGFSTDEIRITTTWEEAMGHTVCVADFNLDGTVNPDDLGDFITCYFTQPPCTRADFNADGNIDPDDLGDFITTYFTGC